MKKNLAIITVAIGLPAALFLAGCQQPTTPTDKYNTTPPNPPVTMENVKSSTTPVQLLPPEKGDTIATIETDKGTIKFKLFSKLAPETSKNFVELAKTAKYDNVPFHRVIEGFMIQTGDFTNKNGTGGYSYKGPGTKFDNEFSTSLHHLKGTVSMANSGPNTNGSQFFIVTANEGTPFLDNSYNVFGQVFEGQDVADAISKTQTGPMDKPVTPILMKKVTISTL